MAKPVYSPQNGDQTHVVTALLERPAHDILYQIYRSDSYWSQYQRMGACCANLSAWPGEMARHAKYSLLGPGLRDLGDNLNGLYADNPIAKMGFLCYTRPVIYQGKTSVGDTFTLDPRYLDQILVSPYTNPNIATPSDGTQAYFGYTPKILFNSYALLNTNEVNTFTNTFTLLSDPSVEYIDYEFDLGQRVTMLARACDGSILRKLTFDDQYTLANAGAPYRVDQFAGDGSETPNTAWTNNIDLRNFALALLVPANDTHPAGWNWVFVGHDGLDSQGNLYFMITNPGLLGPEELTASNWPLTSKIYRVRLKLEQRFKDAIVTSCSSHGLEPGMPVPFAPTHLNKAIVDGVIADVSLRATVGPNPTLDPAAIGALTNVDDLSTVPAPAINTVQLYDLPMSRGGLWVYLLSPPLALFPRYVSRVILNPTSPGYGNGGSSLPYFYAAQTEAEIELGWGWR